MNEPIRKSYLDLIKSNLAAAGITEFITRFVYFGEFHGTDDYVQKKFETVINYLRTEFPEDHLTGLLLVYPQYFIHLIETTEELIYRHFDAIFNDKEMSIKLGRVLPLPPQHHAYHFFFPSWFKVSAKPPELLEKIEGTGWEEIKKQMTNCLSKVYILCDYISSTANGSIRSVEELLLNLRDRDQRYLPENTVIEFLLKSNSSILRDLREYVNMAQQVPFFRLYNENIWPPPCDFMPRDVFVDHTSRRDLMLQRLSQQQQSKSQIN